MAKKEERTVMVPTGRSPFRRSVFSRPGVVTKQLVFEPGVPVTLSGRDLDAVRDDIGKALVEMVADEGGVLRSVAQMERVALARGGNVSDNDPTQLGSLDNFELEG